MANQPESWGGRNTTKDYEFFMEGSTPIASPISLAGTHALTSPGQNLTDQLTERYVAKQNGLLVERERVIRQAEELSLTFTIFFGAGLETPALVRARRRLDTTFYGVRLCPSPGEGHAYIWPDTIMNPPARVNDAIQVSDTAMADWQSELRAEQEILLKELGAFSGVVEQNDDPYYAVGFFGSECNVGSETPNSRLIAVGGDGTAAMVVDITANRFASVTQPSTMPAPVGSVGTSVAVLGENRVLVGFSDLDKSQFDEITEPAAGGTIFSADGGDNFVIDGNITVPIMAVGRFGGEWFAAGGAGGAAAFFGTSTDGINFTDVSNIATLSATAALTDAAVDEVTGNIYAVAQDGTLWVGVSTSGSIFFSEITTIPGAPATLYSVHVLGQDHLAIGGASGYYAESFDGGTTWSQPSAVNAGSVFGITGTQWRALVGNATALFSRWVTSDYNYESVPPQNGATISGNVTGVAQTQESSEYNTFAFVTDDGETFFVRDFSPYSA